MRKLVAVLALSLGILAAPALAQAQGMPAVMTSPAEPHVILASFPATIHDLENMPLEQGIAIIGGAALGALLVDSFIERGIVTLGGAAIGAIGGNLWYERRYWPF